MKLNNIKKWQDIYHKNIELDKIFDRKYKKDHPDMYEKNCLEFLVELGEFTNETKCFKYWSVKSPDKEKLLEEFADCITMTLYFYNILNLEINCDIEHTSLTNPLYIINYLYSEGTKLIEKLTPVLITDIFNNLIYLSTYFDISEEEILYTISLKQDIIFNRLNNQNY